MAKATVTCTCATCGATFEIVKVCRNRRDANSFEAWAENTCDECRDCYRARKERERAEAAKKQAAQNAENGFAELQGSPKQIAWALSIRARLVQDIEDEIDRKGIEENGGAEARELLARYDHRVRAETSARWWIEHRDVFAACLLEEILSAE